MGLLWEYHDLSGWWFGTMEFYDFQLSIYWEETDPN